MLRRRLALLLAATAATQSQSSTSSSTPSTTTPSTTTSFVRDIRSLRNRVKLDDFCTQRQQVASAISKVEETIAKSFASSSSSSPSSEQEQQQNQLPRLCPSFDSPAARCNELFYSFTARSGHIATDELLLDLLKTNAKSGDLKATADLLQRMRDERRGPMLFCDVAVLGALGKLMESVCAAGGGGDGAAVTPYYVELIRMASLTGSGVDQQHQQHQQRQEPEQNNNLNKLRRRVSLFSSARGSVAAGGGAAAAAATAASFSVDAIPLGGGGGGADDAGGALYSVLRPYALSLSRNIFDFIFEQQYLEAASFSEESPGEKFVEITCQLFSATVSVCIQLDLIESVNVSSSSSSSSSSSASSIVRIAQTMLDKLEGASDATGSSSKAIIDDALQNLAQYHFVTSKLVPLVGGAAPSSTSTKSNIFLEKFAELLQQHQQSLPNTAAVFNGLLLSSSSSSSSASNENLEFQLIQQTIDKIGKENEDVAADCLQIILQQEKTQQGEHIHLQRVRLGTSAVLLCILHDCLLQQTTSVRQLLSSSSSPSTESSALMFDKDVATLCLATFLAESSAPANELVAIFDDFECKFLLSNDINKNNDGGGEEASDFSAATFSSLVKLFAAVEPRCGGADGGGGAARRENGEEIEEKEARLQESEAETNAGDDAVKVDAAAENQREEVVQQATEDDDELSQLTRAAADFDATATGASKADVDAAAAAALPERQRAAAVLARIVEDENQQEGENTASNENNCKELKRLRKLLLTSSSSASSCSLNAMAFHIEPAVYAQAFRAARDAGDVSLSLALSAHRTSLYDPVRFL